MHRSGTSLLSNWMIQCGLDMGRYLAGATPSNVLGHFEDIEFLEFHEKLLRHNETNLYQGEGTPLEWNDFHEAKAKSLVYLKDLLSKDQWGFKQPRAALFFPLWLKIIPDAFYLLPYRHYNQIVGSLYNREYNKLARKNPAEKVPALQEDFKNRKKDIQNSYLSMWIRHNQEVLDHVRHIDENQYCIFPIEEILSRGEELYDRITNDWNFNLNEIPVEKLYQKKLMGSYELEGLDDQLVEKANIIYDNLQKFK